MKRKRKDSHGSQLNPFSFFIIMHFPSHFNKLRIPRTSAKTLCNELSNEVFLRVPTGETRKVGLLKEGNELWFSDGWQEFVKHFVISIHHFLVFKYEGDSTFTVNIMDLSACEIHYQCSKRNTSQVHHKPHYEGIKIDGDEFDHNISHDKKMSNETECAPFGYPLWLRKYKGLINSVTAAGFSLPKNPFFITAIKSYNLQSSTAILNIPSPFGVEHFRCEVNQRRLIKLEAYDGRQWEVACARYSIKWAFTKGWRHFAQDIGLRVGDICVFSLTNLKKSVLKVHVIKKSHCSSQELLGDKESPKIQLLRSVKLKKSNEREETEFGYPQWMRKYERLMNVINSAGFTLPKNPFFLASIKPYNLTKGVYLNVPTPFACKHLGCEVNQCRLIKLVAPDGTQWEVDCCGYSMKFSFSKGWISIARNIGLNIGDMCVFELINANKCVLKVHVVKRPHNTSQVLTEDYHQVHNDGNKGNLKLRHSPPVNLKKSTIKVSPPDSEDDKNVSDDNEEMHNEREYTKLRHPLWMRKYEGLINVITSVGIPLPENPFFIASIKPYNLEGQTYLNVPRPFGLKHLRCEVNKKKLVNLEAPDGMQREIFCLRDSVEFAFRQGWKIFARYIGLNVGDICIFQLTNVKKTVLKVHVVKAPHNTSQVLHEHHQQGFDNGGKKSPEVCHSPSVGLKKTNVEINLLDSDDDQKVSDDEEMHNEREYPKLGYPLWMRKYEGLMNVVTAAGISLPENSFFLATMKLYNLKRGVLNMPKPFGRKLLRCEGAQQIRHKLIQLEAPDGTLWGVECCRDSVKFTLSKGWKIFALGIGLNVGDICIFEQVNAKMYVLKVHIIKRSQIKAEEHTF